MVAAVGISDSPREAGGLTSKEAPRFTRAGMEHKPSKTDIDVSGLIAHEVSKVGSSRHPRSRSPVQRITFGGDAQPYRQRSYDSPILSNRSWNRLKEAENQARKNQPFSQEEGGEQKEEGEEKQDLIRITVPCDKLKWIIGRNGVTVEMIETDTKCAVSIEENSRSGPTSVKLRGLYGAPAEAGMKICDIWYKELSRQKELRESDRSGDFNISSSNFKGTITILSEVANHIAIKESELLVGIEDRSGCKIYFPPKVDHVYCNIDLVGTESQVEKAQTLILYEYAWYWSAKLYMHVERRAARAGSEHHSETARTHMRWS